MVRENLIEAILVQNPDLSIQDAKKIVLAFFEKITATLAAGGRVELRGFGSFATSPLAATLSRNPRSGEPVVLDERRTPRFKAGKSLREAVARSGQS